MTPYRRSFKLNMSTFTDDSPTAKLALQIRMRNWYQVHLQTYKEDGAHSLTFFDEECSDEVISNPFTMSPPVITLLPLRRLCVLHVLASMDIEGSLCECLAPKIEKYVFRAAETFGHKGFGVVVELQVTQAYVYDQKTDRKLMCVNDHKALGY